MENKHERIGIPNSVALILSVLFIASPVYAQRNSDERLLPQPNELGWVQSSPERQLENPPKQRIAYASKSEIQQAALSILRMVTDMCSPRNEVLVVKVPTYNFLGILQELQDRHAKFLPPNSKTPSNAKAIFRLQAEQAGLSQIVYLPN